ncbi:MAG: GNAT family N-acetyltransferase [Halioglobus sp.]|nr:GNAT family N-acetyltransferase [Halioglobus sp.]
MSDRYSPIEIEKIFLPDQYPGGQLLEAFSDYERVHMQFGADWLANLTSHALSEDESGIIFTARLCSGDVFALPLKLNARTRQAHALGNFYTSMYSPVFKSSQPDRLLVALLRHLACKERFTGLTLSPLDTSSPLFGQLQAALTQSGWKDIHQYPCHGNWTLELNGNSYADYLSTRPSRLQNTIIRRTRQFLKDGRGRLDLIEESAALEQSIATFTTIYKQSWKQEEPYPEFIPELLRLAARRGWLRLGLAHYDGAPIAGQVWFVSEHTAYIFKLAHGEAFTRHSPGTILTAFMMEHVITRDGVSTIDFLSGDDKYKQDWMSIRRNLAGIAACNPNTMRGCAMLASRWTKSIVKQWRTSAITNRIR